MFKKLLAITLAAMISFPILADNKQEFCNGIKQIAESMMYQKQWYDYSYEDQLNFIKQHNGDKDPIVMMILNDAYIMPSVYNTDEYKNKEVKRFKDRWFRLCYNQTIN